jgi:hypothetical protein
MADVLIALVAGGGQEPAAERVLGYLEDHAASDLDGTDQNRGPRTGKVVSALVAAGEDPRAFAGTDFVARLRAHEVGGRFGGSSRYADLLAMLAVLAAGDSLSEASVQSVKAAQCPDGGWTPTVAPVCSGSERSTDTTALATAVMAATLGRSAGAVVAGRQWLLDAQAPSGCWGDDTGKDPNANSCALAVSAVVSLDEDPSGAPWSVGDRDAPVALRGFQLVSGGFRWGSSGEENQSATVQAVPGLAGWTHPVEPPTPPDPGTSTSSTTTTTGTSGTGPGTSTSVTSTSTSKTVAPAGGTTRPGSRAGPRGDGGWIRALRSAVAGRVATTTDEDRQPHRIRGWDSIRAAEGPGRPPVVAGEARGGKRWTALIEDDGGRGGVGLLAAAIGVSGAVVAGGATAWIGRRRSVDRRGVHDAV